MSQVYNSHSKNFETGFEWFWTLMITELARRMVSRHSVGLQRIIFHFISVCHQDNKIISAIQMLEHPCSSSLYSVAVVRICRIVFILKMALWDSELFRWCVQLFTTDVTKLGAFCSLWALEIQNWSRNMTFSIGALIAFREISIYAASHDICLN